MDNEQMLVRKYVKRGAAFLFLFTLLMGSIRVIQPGQRGVRITLGKVATYPVEPGLVLKLPFVSRIERINVQIQKTEVDATAATKDLQETQTHVALNWHVAPGDVTRLYTEIG